MKGQYSLVEPDGSVRTVDYSADPVNGFNAVVSKSAPSVHVAPVVKEVVPAVVKQVVPVSYVKSAPVVAKTIVASPSLYTSIGRCAILLCVYMRYTVFI